MSLRRLVVTGSSLALMAGVIVAAPGAASAQETIDVAAEAELVVSIDRPVADAQDEQAPMAVAPGSTVAIVVDSFVSELASGELFGDATVSLRLPRGLSWRTSSSLGPIGSPEWSCAARGDQVDCVTEGHSNASLIAVFETGSRRAIDAGGSVDVTVERAGLRYEESIGLDVVAQPVPRIYARNLDGLPNGQRVTAAIGAVALSELADADRTIRVSRLAPPNATRVRLSGESMSCQDDDLQCRTTRVLDVGEPVIAGASFLLPESSPVASWAARASVADPGAGDFSVDVPLTVLRPERDSDPFVVTWRTTQGQAVTQGGQLAADLRVTNISEQTQRAILILRSPRGIGIDESEPQWRCRTKARAGSSRTVCRGPMLESGESADLPASIEARSSHPTGFVELTARGRGSSTDAALALNVVDPGDPVASAGVWVKPKLRWQPWDDGSIRSLPVGQADQWRIVVSNIGGDDLLAGRSATIRQRFAPGVEVVPRTNSASSCDFTDEVLTCTITARRDVAPQERIGAVTLAITPTLAESSIVEGALTARITTARRGTTRTTVTARSIVPVIPVAIRASLPDGATQGGRSMLELTAQRDGPGDVRGMRVIATLPSGVTLGEPVSTRTWRCSSTGEALRCRLLRDLPDGGQGRSIRIPLAVAADAPVGSTVIEWEADHARQAIAGVARTAMTIRPAASLSATASPALVVSGSTAASTRTVMLNAGLINPGPTSWDITWTQDCLEGNGARQCRGISSAAVELRHANHHRAEARIDTQNPGKYRFTVTARDGSLTVTDSVEVQVVSRSTGSAEMRTYDPPRRTVLTAPTTPRLPALITATAAPTVTIDGAPLIIDDTGATVNLSASSSDSGVSYAWRQLIGPSVDLDSQGSTASFTAPDSSASLAFAVDVTGANGATATGVVSVAIAPEASAGFCKAVAAIQAAQSGSPVDLGGVTAQFGSVTVSPGPCSTSTTITYSNTSFDLGSATVTGASGTLSTGGISINAGSLTPPSSWSVPAFSLDNSGATLLWSGDGSSVSAVGTFTLSQMVFLPLPDGWSGTTQIVLGTSSELSSLSIDAVATGPGSAIATFTGSAATDGTFSLAGEAKDLVQIAGAGIDAKGTLTRAAADGSITGSLSGSLTSPATLATGVTIPSLAVTWSMDDTPVLSASGELALSAGGSTATLAIDLDYTDPQNWSATVQQGGSGDWKPIDGIDIPVGDVTGSVANSSGTLSWDLTASLDSPWSPTSVLTVTDIELSIANTCPASITALVDCGSGDAFLALTGSASVDGGSVGTFTVDADAVVELGSSAGFALAGSLAGNVTITDGLDLTGGAILAYRGLKPTFASPTEQGGSGSDFTVAAVGAMTIPKVGNISQIQATVNDDGWVVAAYLDNVVIGGDASLGTVKQGVVAYSSYATTITNGQDPKAAPIDLKAGEMLIAATYNAPQWFLTTVDAQEFLLQGSLAIDPAQGTLTATLTLDTPGLTLGAKGSAVSFGIASIGFVFSTNDAGDVLLAIDGTIDMDLPTAYGSAPPTLTLSMSFTETDGTETVSASFELSDKTGWKDAFGFTGLTLDDLVISFGLEVSAVPLPLPTIALSASASLPSTLREPLSMPSDAVVSVFAELAEETPCLGLGIHGPQGSTENVLSIAGGVITAQSVDVYVAPAGCTIGTTIYTPGLAMEFDGAVLGDKVDVGSKLVLSPFSFDATVDIGGFQVGPLQMEESVLDVHMAAGTDDSVAFAGGFDLFGTSVSASGGLSFDAGTTTGDLDIATNGFSVSGFDITNTSFSMKVTSDVAKTSVEIAGSGSVSVLGDSLDVKEFDITIANNVVDKIDAQIDTTIDIAPSGDAEKITIDGTFDLDYTAQPETFDVTASATVDVGDYSLANGTLNINDSCASLTAKLDLPDVVTASLAGYIVYTAGCSIPDPSGSGTISVAGGPGSFCGYASVSGISIGTFSAAGSVSLANNGDVKCAGSGTTPDTLTGSLTADLRLGAQQTQSSIDVSGTFSGDGTFSLTGSGTLDIGGFDLQATVSAAKTDSGSTVSGKGSVDLLGTTIDVSGSFSNVNGYPTTSLTASGQTLDLGGYKPSGASISLDQSKDAFGLSASLTLKLGVIDFSSKTTFHDTNGDVRFYASDSLDLDIPRIAGANFGAVLTNCTDSSCSASASDVSFTGSGHFSFLQWNFAAADFDIATNGDFSATSSSGGTLSGSKTFICKFSVQAQYTVSVTIGQKNLSPQFNTSDSVKATGSGCNRSVSLSASLQLQPLKVCVNLPLGLGRLCLP